MTDKEKLEEPVSKDLEEAAKEYVIKEGYLAGLHYNSMVRSFKAGANWQKQQEYTCYEEAFEDGAKWKYEQMMKDAGDVMVKNLDLLSYWDCLTKLGCVDKDIVKVICVKEE